MINQKIRCSYVRIFGGGQLRKRFAETKTQGDDGYNCSFCRFVTWIEDRKGLASKTHEMRGSK